MAKMSKFIDMEAESDEEGWSGEEDAQHNDKDSADTIAAESTRRAEQTEAFLDDLLDRYGPEPSSSTAQPTPDSQNPETFHDQLLGQYGPQSTLPYSSTAQPSSSSTVLEDLELDERSLLFGGIAQRHIQEDIFYHPKYYRPRTPPPLDSPSAKRRRVEEGEGGNLVDFDEDATAICGLLTGRPRKMNMSARQWLANHSKEVDLPSSEFFHGQWVRVNEGMYAEDVGLFEGPDPDNDKCGIVYLVPRLDIFMEFDETPHLKKAGKRKRLDSRPIPRLFSHLHHPKANPTKVRKTIQVPSGRDDWIMCPKDLYDYELDGQHYECGLWKASIPYSNLVLTSEANSTLVKLFMDSKHPTVLNNPLPTAKYGFNVDERVLVTLTSPQTGGIYTQRGVFKETIPDRHLVCLVEIDLNEESVDTQRVNDRKSRKAVDAVVSKEPVLDLVEVEFNRIQRDIEPLDVVEILDGPHKGKEMVVLAMRWGELLVQDPQSKEMFPGIELSVCRRISTGSESSFDHRGMPWLNMEVEIIQEDITPTYRAVGMDKGAIKAKIEIPEGRFDRVYIGKVGIVKDVRLERGHLVLQVYFPCLQHSADFPYDCVGTIGGKRRLHEVYPLSQENHRYYWVDPFLKLMSSGVVPWIGIRVMVAGQGNHKGLVGIVKNVNRKDRGKRLSKEDYGRWKHLDVEIELQVMTGGQACRIETVNCSRLVEITTRKPLYEFAKLGFRNRFYMPYYKVYNKEPLEYRLPPSNPPADPLPETPSTPMPEYDGDPFDFDDPWNPASECFGRLSYTTPTPSRAASPTHSQSFCYPTDYSPRSPSPAPPSPTSSNGQPPSACSHWILHPNLLDKVISVSIDGGQFDTSRKKKGLLVRTFRDNDTGNIIVGTLDEPPRPVPVDNVRTSTIRPKANGEMGLMIVVRGKEEHIGKHVRRIHNFFVGTAEEPDKYPMMILAVVNRLASREEEITSELLELHTDDVEYVDETDAERKKSREQFKPLRDEAKKKKKIERRLLGPEDSYHLPDVA